MNLSELSTNTLIELQLKIATEIKSRREYLIIQSSDKKIVSILVDQPENIDRFSELVTILFSCFTYIKHLVEIIQHVSLTDYTTTYKSQIIYECKSSELPTFKKMWSVIVDLKGGFCNPINVLEKFKTVKYDDLPNEYNRVPDTCIEVFLSEHSVPITNEGWAEYTYSNICLDQNITDYKSTAYIVKKYLYCIRTCSDNEYVDIKAVLDVFEALPSFGYLDLLKQIYIELKRMSEIELKLQTYVGMIKSATINNLEIAKPIVKWIMGLTKSNPEIDESEFKKQVFSSVVKMRKIKFAEYLHGIGYSTSIYDDPHLSKEVRKFLISTDLLVLKRDQLRRPMIRLINFKPEKKLYLIELDALPGKVLVKYIKHEATVLKLYIGDTDRDLTSEEKTIARRAGLIIID